MSISTFSLQLTKQTPEKPDQENTKAAFIQEVLVESFDAPQRTNLQSSFD